MGCLWRRVRVARRIDDAKRIFRVNRKIGLLEILPSKFRKEEPRILHILDHLLDAREITADNAKLKLGTHLCSVRVDVLHRNSRSRHTPGQDALEVGEKPGPTESFIRNETMCCAQNGALFGCELLADLLALAFEPRYLGF